MANFGGIVNQDYGSAGIGDPSAFAGFIASQIEFPNKPQPEDVRHFTTNVQEADAFPGINVPIGAFATVVVAVQVNTQANNRGQREKNLTDAGAPFDGMDYGFDWFEKIHVNPQTIALGNVVSDVTQILELYNAFRDDDRTWTVFTNNAGAGITVANLPGLPKIIDNQTSFQVQVQISPSGPPTIDGTLDFTFDVTDISVPITGTRVILFGLPPSGIVTERLAWLTDVMRAADGTEQRLNLRTFPRQSVSFEVLTLNDLDRNQLNAFLFDWHSRVFGVPLWWDSRIVTQDVAINDATINVVTTDWADFRVGGLAVVIAFDADGNRTADTLEISAVNSSPPSVDFTSGTSNAYTAGQTLLVPVVPGILNSRIAKSRFPSTNQNTTLDFLLLDNDSTSVVADTSTFNSFNSRTVIDDPNCVDRQITEGYRKKITRIDGDTGEVVQESSEDRSTPLTQKRWEVEKAQRLWEIRSLLYAIRGEQVSFYMPTFNEDVSLIAPVGAGGSSIDITSIGYTQFIKSREPFTTIAVRFVDGFVPEGSPGLDSPLIYAPGQGYLFFNITGATQLTDTTERLLFGDVAPFGFTEADVERVEFIVLSRFDSDTVELIHKWTDSLGDEIDSQVNAPISGVYDS